MVDFDAIIDAELSVEEDPFATPYHSWQWWPQGNARKLCQKCKARYPGGDGRYRTCMPCLDGLAAYYEALGDLTGDEDGE